jgi:hypothetical protein
VGVLDKMLGVIPEIWKPSAQPAVERLFSLRAGATGPRGDRSFYELYEDQQIVANSKELGSVLEAFDSQLKIYLAEKARGRVFVHAGAVGWQGRAIIIPGRSMSGKTSLVAELVRAGATYYSDEYAVLDRRGRLHPYTAPLAVRQPDSFKQKRCRAEELGGGNGVKPLPVGLVVVSRYEPGRLWQPRRISSGQAVLEMLANAVPARRKPGAVITTLSKAVAEAVALKSSRGEARETAELILDYIIGVR